MRTYGPTVVFGDFNSRLYQIFAGEERFIGPHAFLNPVQQLNPEMNRYLLLRFCAAAGLVITNTFFEHSMDETLTYFDIGTDKNAPASSHGFAQLDIALVSSQWFNSVLDVRSDRKAPLASHHFLTMMYLTANIEKTGRAQGVSRLDTAALQDRDVAKIFANRFRYFCNSCDGHGSADRDRGDTKETCERISRAFHQAARDILPTKMVTKKRPWISSQTLSLIESRLHARRQADYSQEQALSRRIKIQAKIDRDVGLLNLAGSKDWGQLKRLRRGEVRLQGRLHDESGMPVSSEQRADTFARYLAEVQWRVRPAAAVNDRPPLRPTIDIDAADFSKDELDRTLRRMKADGASGPDAVAPRYFTALLGDPWALREILDFCNLCWRTKTVPDSWHNARVRMIFKKGDPAQRDNYRPISVLNLGYKVFAALLLQRLKHGGADQHISPTQFGFKTGHGTTDALFVVRRLLERVWNSKDETLLLLALDWAKAFDAISPACLLKSLSRFGLPNAFVEMIGAIYSSRTFFVSECGTASETCEQRFGISQGCPLSPYLFIMLMSVLITDAQGKLRTDHGVVLPPDAFNELLYADDTLLIGAHGAAMQKYLECIMELGAEYGLELNWKKVELLRARCTDDITKADGQKLEPKTSVVYLGSSIAIDGNLDSELSRRLGMAQAEFKLLHQVWRHASLSKREKYEVYTTCIVSRLLYGLQAMWLRTGQRKQLDAFHAKCLRQILGIQPS